jgi:hypothetical protein
MSEEGSEPDIRTLRMNVAEVHKPELGVFPSPMSEIAERVHVIRPQCGASGLPWLQPTGVCSSLRSPVRSVSVIKYEQVTRSGR